MSFNNGVLVHSAGNVDLGQYAADRMNYILMCEDFTTGFRIDVRNEIVKYGYEFFMWEGTLPKLVPLNTNPDSTGQVKDGAWKNVTLSFLTDHDEDDILIEDLRGRVTTLETEVETLKEQVHNLSNP